MKPMLAGKADLSKLIYPVYVSPKLDGVRAISMNGQLLSRSLKPIPNRHIQSFTFPHGVDGELIVGSPTNKDCYRKTVSAVMSHDKICTFTYYIFDTFLEPSLPYELRTGNFIPSFRAERLPSFKCLTEKHVLMMETQYLKQGYEGLIIRHADAPYKFGRSTVKEGSLLKLKRFKDGEAEIIGMEEWMHNSNPPFTNELGHTAHHAFMGGKEGMNTLGALVVQDIKTSIQFKIGTGFSQTERQLIWDQAQRMNSRLVKYKYFPTGGKDKPRHPVFLGFRDKEDLS